MKRKRTLDVIGFLMVGVILVCGFLNPTPTSTEAATFYVATIGSNSSPGTETQPFQTINKGVGVLKPGDTLLIKNGTYKEWLQWGSSFPAGTSWDAPVTVKAFPGDTVTMLPNVGSGRVISFVGTEYIIIDGLILDGTNVDHDAVKITHGSKTPPAHHIRIQNSEIRNAPKSGILATSNSATTASDDNEFINLDIHDNGTSEYRHGMYIKSKNNIVRGCRIYRNSGWGVHIYNETTPGEASNNVVSNNLLYDNARLGLRGSGIIIGSGSGNTVYNNIIWGNNAGIDIAYNNSSNNNVYHNTIYRNKGPCIKLAYTKNDTLLNNICWGNGSGIQDDGIGTALGANLTTEDPQFVNSAELDFHLRQSSPAIDAGELVTSASDDFDGNPRYQGSAYDIGAYEFIGDREDSTPPARPVGLEIVSK